MMIKNMKMIIVSLIIFITYYKLNQIRNDRISLIQGAVTLLNMSYMQNEDKTSSSLSLSSPPPYSFDLRITYGLTQYSIDLFLSDIITLSEKNAIRDQLIKLRNQYWKSFAGTTLIIEKATFVLKKKCLSE